MFCPLYTNKEVFDGFNQIVEAFGGRALTEEEFRSSELRNLREGLDLSAMNAAYAIYDMNGGYTLDKARNGEPSLLFQALLEANNGDVLAAIRDKSEYYTKEYLAEHRDWLNSNIEKENIKDLLLNRNGDINWEYFESLMDKYHNKQPDSMFAHGRYTLSTRPENHFSEEKNTLNHIKFVTQSMLNLLEGKYDMDLPFVSEARSSLKNQKDLMILAAMFHDVAKPYRHGDIHGWESADILRDVLGLNYDNRLAEWAVRHHMPMPFSHKADFNKSNPEALEVAKNIARDAKRVGIDANTAINAWILINAADVINGRELSVEDNWAKKAANNGPTRYGDDLSVKNVLSIELKEKVELLKWAFEQIKNEDFGDTIYNYNNQERFDYQAFPEGGIKDKALPFLINIRNDALDKNGEPIFNQNESFDEINELINIIHQLNKSNPIINLGEDLVSGKTVSSNIILSNLLSSGAISIVNTELANVLSVHDIPVRLGKLETNVLATTITDENGGSVIIINRDMLNLTSSELLGDSVLHEIIHAVTVPAIDKPSSKLDRLLLKSNNSIYKQLSRIASKYKIYEPIFNNEKEFISIFITNKIQRLVVYDIARIGDSALRNSVKLKIKDFVNSLTSKLLDKKVFLSNQELLEKYRLIVKDYFYNKQPIYKGNLTNKLLFDDVYNNFDVDVANLDKYVLRQGSAQSLLSTILRNNLDINEHKSKDFENIALILNTRLKSVRSRSAQDDVIIKLQQSIKYQIDLITRVSYAEKIIGFQVIAQNLEPQINEDLKIIEKVENGERVFTSSDFLTLLHQDVATYEKVASDIVSILSDAEQLDEFVLAAYDVLPNKKDITTPEGSVDYNKFRYKYIDEVIKPLVATFNNIKALSGLASEKLTALNRKITRDTLKDIFDAVKNPNTDEYLLKLVEIETDAGSFISQIRPMDYELDDALRALGYLVRKANRIADSDTYETIMPVLEGLDKLNKDLKIEDFYEKNGKNTTGYLVREFNYGKFYDDYADEMARINAHINKKYGLNLLLTNRTAPDQEDARREFNDMRNSWLEKNCHRRFINAYYRAQADLPTEAVRQMRSINRLLFQINNLPNITDPKTGYPDYYKLTLELWDVLQEILVRKKMLRSDYDEWGNLKSPEELKIARAILNYYEVLYKDNKGGFDKDRKAWVNARLKFLESLGATGYYNELTDTFDEKGIKEFMKNNKSASKLWNLWNTRNSVHQFKLNQDKEALIFKLIENELGSAKPYYGTKDEDYTKKINDLLNIYHGTNGHINDQMMSIEMIKKLSNLMRKQYVYRQRAKAVNPKLRALAKLYSEILHKYITFEKTERYKLLEEEALKQAMQFGSDDYLYYFIDIMKLYGSVAYAGNVPYEIRPFRWFTNMKAIDEEMWMEWVPGDSFADIENSISYKNEKFKEEYGVSYIPKGNRYDNSKLYNKIKDTLLYKSILETMKKAYSNMENRAHADPYLLPQITGSMYKYMQARAGFKGKFDGAYTWLKDNIGLNGITQNDSDYGYDENYDQEDNQIDESVEDKMRKIGTLKNTPDGHVMHFIPQFYTKRNRPEYISKDLIGIVSTFYNMSSRYKHKSAIKDDCETIVDMLENRTYKKRSGTEREEAILGKDTGTYQKARKFLDMNLYGIRRTKYQVQITPELLWEVTKTVDLLKRYTTANNLGANPKVALVGFLTTYYGHIINSIVGNAYSYDDAWKGAKVVTEYVIKNVALGSATLGYSTDIGKVITDSSIINMMERFNLANQFSKKTHHTNMDRLSRVVYENSVFGMLSSADFFAKATILVSVLHAFRLVNGEFVNKDAIYRNAAKISDQNAREQYITDKLTLYNSKNVITMYDAVDKDSKKFNVKSQYKDAFDKAYYVVLATAEKLAERADGMATEEQKGMITQNIIGSLVLIHRQYLPLQWIESFGAPVYDMDMQTYKGGRFHVMYKYIKELATLSTKNTIIAGSIIGAYLGLGTTGLVPAALIGAAMGYVGGRLSNKYHQHKTVKDVNREFFHDNSSEKSILLSRHRQRVKNLVLAEISMCKVLQILVSMFCGFMDDPDKKNYKIMQFIALVLRLLEWETYSPYRGDDTLSTLKTASPVSGTSDDIQNGFSLAENYTAYLFSNLTGTGTASSPVGLLNTMFLAPQKDIFREMRSGPYEGDQYWEKVLYKLTPWSNTYEQYKDSKGKRKYLENQVFKLNK